MRPITISACILMTFAFFGSAPAVAAPELSDGFPCYPPSGLLTGEHTCTFYCYEGNDFTVGYQGVGAIITGSCGGGYASCGLTEPIGCSVDGTSYDDDVGWCSIRPIAGAAFVLVAVCSP